MSASSHLRDMIDYMKKHGIEEQYEIDYTEDDDIEVTKFSFYNFESFFDFITQEFNFYKKNPDSYQYLYEWYTKGRSLYHLNGNWMKNTTLFRSIEFACTCLFIDNITFEYDISLHDHYGFHTFQYKIVVSYEFFDNDEDEEAVMVLIHMPVICKECMNKNTTNKNVYHSEMLSNVSTFQKNIQVYQCKATKRLEMYSLYEPMLKQNILKFITK